MTRTWLSFVVALALLAGCATAPSTQQMQAVVIEAPAPGQAVLYIVRPHPDFTYHPAPIALDGHRLATTYAGTYVRAEVPPGRHRISGYGVDAGDITVDAQPGRIYFIRQSVAGSYRSFDSLSSFYTIIDEQRARAAMVGASRAG